MSREISMNLNHYEIEYSNNPYEVWNSLETLPPVSPDGHTSLYEFCKLTSRYHFDDTKDDTELIGTNLSPVIPICRFRGDWVDEVTSMYEKSTPATFDYRSSPRREITNSFEENDFRKWGYDIDGGYAINNRTILDNGKVIPNDPIKRFERTDFVKKIQSMFALGTPLAIKLDTQRPGQCFYWHLDNFGGMLKRLRKDYDQEFAGDVDQRKLMRLIVFLEDQQLGHQWQQGNLLLKWKKGDCITWPWRDMPHGTANYGHTNRPTLNITGIVTDETLEFLKYASTTDYIDV